MSRAALVAGFAVASALLVGLASLRPALGAPTAAAVDLLPFWLGARALLAGLDPNDPAALAAVYRAAGLGMPVGGFWSYYPPSAAALAIPLGLLPFRAAVLVFRPLAALALGIGVGAAALAGGRERGWIAAGIAASAVYLLPLGVHVLRVGQPGPLVVAAAGLGLLGLAREAPRATGLASGLGAALKLSPGLLALVALVTRRWRALGLALGAGLLPLGLALALGPAPGLGRWAGALLDFVGRGVDPAWRAPALVIGLWRGRVLALGLPSLGLLAWAARRPTRVDPAALGAALLAWAGTAVAGSHQLHEALQLAPVLGFLAGRALDGGRAAQVGLGAALALLWSQGGLELRGTEASLAWIAPGYAAWVGSALEARIKRDP